MGGWVEGNAYFSEIIFREERNGHSNFAFGYFFPLKKFYSLCFSMMAILVYLSHKIDILICVHYRELYSLIAMVGNIDNILFLIFFVLLLQKIDFRNRIFLFLGNISFAIYAFHGMVIKLVFLREFQSELVQAILSFVVLGMTIVMAYYYHRFRIKIRNMKKL